MAFFEMDTPPYPHYATMRAHAPVFFNPESGVWEVYRYQDIQTVLGDNGTFSSALYSAAGRPEFQSLIVMDQPRHTKFRRLLAKAFTAKMVAAQAPHIQAVTDGLIDLALPTGRIDIAREIAFPLPAIVIAGMLDVPRSDLAQFRDWTASVVKFAEAITDRKEPAPDLQRAFMQFTRYLAGFAQERRANPGDDLISTLASAEVDGERLTIEEISNMCRLILLAGHDTTRILIGNCMHLLLQDDGLMQRVRSDPGLLDSMLEEVFRFATPIHYFARIATVDVALGGQLIKQGQWVLAFNASGNRDSAAFADPDRFDITRSPNRHLGLGYGIHFCMGAALGRLEAKTAVSTLLARLPQLRLDPARPVTRLEAKVQFGVGSLPALFSPG